MSETQNTEGAEVSASSQETTNSEATPAQETTATAAASNATPQPKEETWEYDGNREKVPEPFKKYATAFDRYVSKKDQALAEANKRIADYEQKLKAVPASKTETESAPRESIVTQEELDAMLLGDAKTLEKVIERTVQKRLEASVSPIAMKQKELEAAETIKSFTEIHPDFSELLESPAGEFMIDAARRGASLEQIYDTAKKAEAFFNQKAEAARQATREMKKNGSVAGRTVTGTPDIVYADSEDQAKRLAIELTLKGDKRLVQVKKPR